MIDLQSVYSTGQSLPTLAWNAADFSDVMKQLQSSSPALSTDTAQRLFADNLDSVASAERLGRAAPSDAVDPSTQATLADRLAQFGAVGQNTSAGLQADNGGSYQQWLRQMEANFDFGSAREAAASAVGTPSAASVETDQSRIAASSESAQSALAQESDQGSVAASAAADKKGENSERVSIDPSTGLLKRTVVVDGQVVSESVLSDAQQPMKVAENDSALAQQRVEQMLAAEQQRQAA